MYFDPLLLVLFVYRALVLLNHFYALVLDENLYPKLKFLLHLEYGGGDDDDDCCFLVVQNSINYLDQFQRHKYYYNYLKLQYHEVE